MTFINYTRLEQFVIFYDASDASITLVHFFVLTHLDYCNGVLVDLPRFLVRELKSVVNCAARVVSTRAARVPT